MNIVFSFGDIVSIVIFLLIALGFILYYVGGFLWTVISEAWKMIKSDWTGK